jgi:hypothetical protein
MFRILEMSCSVFAVVLRAFIEIAAYPFADIHSFSNVNDSVFVEEFIDARPVRQVRSFSLISFRSRHTSALNFIVAQSRRDPAACRISSLLTESLMPPLLYRLQSISTDNVFAQVS